MKFIFFGTPDFAALVLDELRAKELTPSLIVTAPNKPKGRKLVLTPSPVRVWANANNIPVICPEKLDDDVYDTIRAVSADLFVVAAYGKLIKKRFLDLPSRGTLNVHPSLLPKFRGASPIESAILSKEKETGVTIMLLDEEMDHGPIVAQEIVPVSPWPPKGSELTTLLAHHGGALLAQTIPRWVNGEIRAVPQDHAQATHTKKITKEDGEITLSGDAEENLKKIRAYDQWPVAYFFVPHAGKSIRVKIIDAEITGDGTLNILRVIPEGKNAMPYEDFMRGLRPL